MSNQKSKWDLSSNWETTRRTFLAGSSAATAFALGAGSALSDDNNNPAKAGGHAIFAVQGSSSSDALDPSVLMDAHTYLQNFAIRNCLVEVNESGELVPELAESWDVTPDAQTWSFKIRDGIEFHNGKTMNVDDVIASLNLHRGENSESAVKVLAEQIGDITKDGDRLVVTLAEPNADFVYLLSSPEFVVMPAEDGAVDTTSGNGTGGYILELFEPGARTELARFPNYWKPDSAHFETAEIVGVNDGTARMNALTSGDVDAINRVDYRVADLLGESSGVGVVEYGGTLHYSFPMNTSVAPFDDNNVRLAIKYGVDRDMMLQTILGGHGSLGNDQPIGPANRYYASDIPQRAYDPDKAKHYLDQTDYASLDLTLFTSDGAFQGAVDAAVLISEFQKASGINIDVNRSPADGYWTDVWLQKPWFATWWGGRPTEDWMFSIAYADGAAWNDTSWSHELFNKLLIDARAELDEQRRAEMYREMQMLVRDEGGALIPLFANHIAGVSDSIGYKPIAPTTYELSNYRAIERWWRNA